MGEGEGGGEGFEGAMVEDVFADLGVIASWYRQVRLSSHEGGGICCRRSKIPAMTNLAPSRSFGSKPANALIARPTSFFRSNRLMLRSTFLSFHNGLLSPSTFSLPLVSTQG